MNENSNEMASVEVSESTRYAKTTKARNRRKNGRFNFVDFFLILLIIAAIAGVVAYFMPGITSFFSSRKETSIKYVIEFTGVDGDFAANIEANDPVYDAGRNYEIGTVSSVKTENHSVVTYNETTGEAVYVEHPELKNIIVTVEVKAVYTSGEGYHVNGQRIAVGKAFNVRFPGFSGNGYCIDLIDDSQ